MEKRFQFGENWLDYLSHVDDGAIKNACQNLKDFAGNLEGKSFIDIGCGSGVHSLSAKLLGASPVYSVDYDLNSVKATRQTKALHYEGDDWTIEQGDILNFDHQDTYDIVYSWGVLHHTGNMHKALEAVAPLVKPQGHLFISIYNDQGLSSKSWHAIKKTYAHSNKIAQSLILWGYIVYQECRSFFGRLIKGQNPFSIKHWTQYKKSRGMSRFHDYKDWIGGYPFEVAKPEEIFDFYTQRGFVLERLSTCAGGSGCNQFLFKKT